MPQTQHAASVNLNNCPPDILNQHYPRFKSDSFFGLFVRLCPQLCCFCCLIRVYVKASVQPFFSLFICVRFTFTFYDRYM